MRKKWFRLNIPSLIYEKLEEYSKNNQVSKSRYIKNTLYDNFWHEFLSDEIQNLRFIMWYKDKIKKSWFYNSIYIEIVEPVYQWLKLISDNYWISITDAINWTLYNWLIYRFSSDYRNKHHEYHKDYETLIEYWCIKSDYDEKNKFFIHSVK